jgi:hypothetical protein
VGVDGFTLDHKGFYVTKFLDDSSEPIHIDSVPVDPRSGVSINWSPTKFHHGSFSEVDFSNWAFANHSSWVIGALRGKSAGADAGIWLIDWVSNMWIRLTPESSSDQRDNPAVFFTGTVTGLHTGAVPFKSNDSRLSVRSLSSVNTVFGPERRIDLGPGVQSVDVFSARGECLFRYRRQATGTRSILIPEGLSQQGVMLIRKY